MSSELDRKSKRVLEAIYQHGGEAEMGEIKGYTGIEKNGIILYRLNKKLGPEGLVETRKVDGESGLGMTVASLTERGEQVVGRVMDDDSGPSLSEQVNMLTTEVERLREMVEMYEGHLDAVAEATEGVPEAVDRMERVEGRIEEFDDRLTEVENQPFEQIAEEKMAELRKVAHRVEEADYLNQQVRGVLKRNGVLQPTRRADGSDGYKPGHVLDQMTAAANPPRQPQQTEQVETEESSREPYDPTTEFDQDDQAEPEFLDTEEGREAVAYLREFDPIAENIRHVEDLVDHLQAEGFDVGESEVEALCNKVAVWR